MISARLIVVLFALAGSTAVTAAESWPDFRGPNQDGQAGDANLPDSWSESENVTWKTETPLLGLSWLSVLPPTFSPVSFFCFVLLLGSSASFFCLVLCFSYRFLCLVPLLGSSAWFLCLAPLLGSFAWFLCLVLFVCSFA